MYKAVIVEDDSLSAEAFSDLLKGGEFDIEVAAVFDSVSSAITGIRNSAPDLLFLDMELGDGKGFDVLQAIGEISFEVIITTAHETYMLEAIKHSALDYLLKPVEKQELREAFRRFEKRIAQKVPKVDQQSVKSNKLVIPNQEGLILVEIEDILRLESDGPYTTLHLAGGQKKVSSKNLGFYEESLKHHSFFRVHHSHVVNLNHVANYVRGEGGHVVLSDKSIVAVSRRKKEDFLSVLGV
ncbi:LytTR family DNA-binding domain-containing protein [Cryomorphaceae bacterium 1068]|nr:LytTR family DNA-binding domain-containing protein [Cryomorphaceae bacterium 1068]